MIYIDMDKWERKEHFNFFHRMDYPQFNICANLDVTNFLHYVRTNKLQFYYAMIHASTSIANQIINFRYRIREDKVILHGKTHPSFTAIEDENDLFKLVTVEMKDDIFEFAKHAVHIGQYLSELQKYIDYSGKDSLC